MWDGKLANYGNYGKQYSLVLSAATSHNTWLREVKHRSLGGSTPIMTWAVSAPSDQPPSTSAIENGRIWAWLAWRSLNLLLLVIWPRAALRDLFWCCQVIRSCLPLLGLVWWSCRDCTSTSADNNVEIINQNVLPTAERLLCQGCRHLWHPCGLFRVQANHDGCQCAVWVRNLFS